MVSSILPTAWDIPQTIRRRLGNRVGRQRAMSADGHLLLVMHAPTDDTVGIDNAGRIFQTARHPKSFVALDGADHLLSQPHQARYTGDIIAAWASKYSAAERGH